MYFQPIKRSNNSLARQEYKDLPNYQSLKSILEFAIAEPKKPVFNKGKIKYGHVKDPWNSSDASIIRKNSLKGDLFIQNSSCSKIIHKKILSVASIKPKKLFQEKLLQQSLENKSESILPSIKKDLSHNRVFSQIYETFNTEDNPHKGSYRPTKRPTTKIEKISSYKPQDKLPQGQNLSFKYKKEYCPITGWDTEN